MHQVSETVVPGKGGETYSKLVALAGQQFGGLNLHFEDVDGDLRVSVDEEVAHDRLSRAATEALRAVHRVPNPAERIAFVVSGARRGLQSTLLFEGRFDTHVEPVASGTEVVMYCVDPNELVHNRTVLGGFLESIPGVRIVREE